MVVQTPSPSPPAPDLETEAGVIEDARARQRRYRRIGGALLVAAAAVGALILGMGGGGGGAGAGRNPVGRSSAGGAGGAAHASVSQGVKFSDCMRAHGVSNYPDPSTSGGGLHFSITPSMGINPQAPAFQAAQRSCRHLAPSGGQPSAQASAQAKAQLLKKSECMRAHGITDFPDPQTGSPPSNQAGYSAVLGISGAFLAIPSSINMQSPAFKQAAAACNFGS